MNEKEFSEWSHTLLALDRYENEPDSIKFLQMVESVNGSVDQEMAELLLKTFNNDEDYEIQETVKRILTAADISVYYPALVMSLPRLVAESNENEWPEILLGIEFGYRDHNRLAALVKLSDDPAIKEAFKSIIGKESFLDDYPIAETYLKQI